MKTTACTLATIATCWLAVSVVHADNLLVNGDFENEPNWNNGISGDLSYTALTGNQIPGWTIEPDHAVTVHNCCRYLLISGNYSVNTDGEGWNGQDANFYQDFGSTAGASYTLAFDWECWFINSGVTNKPLLNVSVVDTVTAAVLFNFYGAFTYNGDFHHVATNFLGTGNALRLRIQEDPESHVNDNEFIVDNFSVTGVLPVLPQLGISRLAPFQAALSWSTNATGFILESAPSLPAATWNPVTNAPVVTNDQFAVAIYATNAQQFFRLHGQ